MLIAVRFILKLQRTNCCCHALRGRPIFLPLLFRGKANTCKSIRRDSGGRLPPALVIVWHSGFPKVASKQVAFAFAWTTSCAICLTSTFIAYNISIAFFPSQRDVWTLTVRATVVRKEWRIRRICSQRTNARLQPWLSTVQVKQFI